MLSDSSCVLYLTHQQTGKLQEIALSPKERRSLRRISIGHTCWPPCGWWSSDWRRTEPWEGSVFLEEEEERGKKCTHCKHKRGHDRVAQVNSLEAGLDVKYLSILLCIEGIRQQQRTAAFSAIIPRKKLINKKVPTMKKCKEINKKPKKNPDT